MTSSVWHLLTQRHRRVQSDAIATKMSRLRRRDLHKVGAKAACVDAVAAYVDVAGFFFNVVKEDIIFKKIGAARRRWSVRSKVLSDDLEEDDDLYNKLKCDQDTSDDQIAADNVKISTLETSISGENASVAQITEDIDTVEKDLLAKSEISEFSNVTAICEK